MMDGAARINQGPCSKGVQTSISDSGQRGVGPQEFRCFQEHTPHPLKGTNAVPAQRKLNATLLCAADSSSI